MQNVGESFYKVMNARITFGAAESATSTAIVLHQNGTHQRATPSP
jgi:hypothetical protein